MSAFRETLFDRFYFNLQHHSVPRTTVRIIELSALCRVRLKEIPL